MLRVHPFYMQMKQQGCVKNTNSLMSVSRKRKVVGVARRHWQRNPCKQPHAGHGGSALVEPEVLN